MIISNKLKKIYRKINKLPKSVRIEACSLCQLNCRDCYMRTKLPFEALIGNGYLKFDDYKKFIERNSYIENIELSLSGEIFLNPDLAKIIEYSNKKNISLTAFNGVNFNNVSDEMLETLVKYNFKGLTISLDAAKNETYIKYRYNGNFDNVISNIEKLNSLKEKYNSKFPIINAQFIVFKHNINEIEEAKELAKKLKMTALYFAKPWNDEVEITFDKLYIANDSYYDEEIQNILQIYNTDICYQPWIQPQINWDGRLLGCCCSTHRAIGLNVFKKDLKNCLNSKEMRFMRNVLTGKTESEDTIACHRCFRYHNMKKNNHFLNKKEIEYN